MARRIVTALIVLACVILLAAVGVWYAIKESGVLEKQVRSAPSIALPLVTTRGHFHGGRLTPGHDAYDYETTGDVPGLAPDTAPPDYLLVLIHGFNNDPAKALYKFDIAHDSLRRNGYEGAVVGLSWDADTQHDPISMTGYHEGRRHARGNGPKLAQFLQDYKARCPGTRLHVLGYSMGALVALETLLSLDEDAAFESAQLIVDTVHLLGAAVDNEEVETDEEYGRAIENRAVILLNYYSPVDEKLARYYPFKEADRALGMVDIEHAEMKPFNYISHNVSAELVSYDDAGNPELDKLGRNHSGYLGNKDAQGTLLDDGVMDLLAEAILVYQAPARVP